MEKKLKPFKFTIDVKTWDRGRRESTNNGEIYLHSSETGKKCCLGFFGEACKVKDIIDKYSPENVSSHDIPINSPFRRLLNDHPYLKNSSLCCDLMAVNDRPKMGLQARIKRLKTLFKQIEIYPEFINLP